jgi:hypothetical protein
MIFATVRGEFWAAGARGMASILPFLPRGVFDEEATRLMAEAFDSACRELHDTGQPRVVQEVIAKRIIEAARKGERDPTRLRQIGLVALARASRQA